MGWETIAMVGFSALSASNQIQQGKASAAAAVKAGEEQTITSANNTVISAGRAQNSFLSSGLSLEGGPQAALAQIFNTGNTNISRIAENANNQASNAISQARSAALATLGKTAAMAAGSFGGSSASGSSWSTVDSFDTSALNSGPWDSIGTPAPAFGSGIDWIGSPQAPRSF